MSRPDADVRRRVVVELSEDLDALLDHVSGVLGTPKAQLVARALVDALPALLGRADGFQGRARGLRAGVEDLGQARSVTSTRRHVSQAGDVLDGFVSDLVDAGDAA